MNTSIEAPAHLDLAWTLSCTAMVFLMQAGFCLLEGGMVRTRNTINVAVKNLLDTVVSVLVFGLIGFSLMFGADVGGLVGIPGSVDFLSDNRIAGFFLFQLVFCGTATTVISGAIAERTRLVTFLIIVLFVSAVVYPIAGHWVWGGLLEGTNPGWLAGLGFVDFAGSTAVHVVGGFSALAAAIVIGPRRNIPNHGVSGGHSLTLAVLGCFLLWFGWWGFNGGSCFAVTSELPRVLINTNFAAAAGGLTAAVICLAYRGRVEVTPLITGVLAGLVSVTAGCDKLTPLMAAFTGAVGAGLAFIAECQLRARRIDDVVSAFPVHGIAGIWGTIAVALLAEQSMLATPRLAFLAVQLVGTLAVAVASFGSVYGLLKFAGMFMRLRVTAEQEALGLNMAEHGATNEVLDLVTEMHAHQLDGNFSRHVTVEPHTEAGQIAAQYNRVIGRVQEEISGREEANLWLKSERLRLQSVLTHAGVGIYQLNEELEFTAVNPTLLETLGYRSAAQLLNSGPIEVTPWLTGSENESVFRESLKTGVDVRNLETKIVSKHNKELWLLESLVPVRDDSGNLINWLGTVHDITDRKQAMIAEVKIAQAKSQAKGEFLANMSHEIRTPLNGVIGMLDLLAGTQMPEQGAHYVSIARTSADSLLSVINDILDFSKIEAGRMDIETIKFNLREVVESTSEQFAIRAHSAGLELNCDVEPMIPASVLGDPERLRQVLINLLSNAVKFTLHGEVNLRVGYADGRIEFAVEDTGIGMSTDQCSRMFEAFTQADTSTTREFGGTGLGLTISYQLVELMGGSLKVESTKGKGSRFYFSLPLPVVEEEALADDRLQRLLRSLPNTRILVVDDNSTNCEILKTQLETWGFSAEICQNSELAADRLIMAQRKNKPFDAMLLDLCMPVMDGKDVARLVRSSNSFNDLPIILLSSNHEIMDEHERADCGIDIAMTKPVRQSRLFDSILTVLKDRLDCIEGSSRCLEEKTFTLLHQKLPQASLSEIHNEPAQEAPPTIAHQFETLSTIEHIKQPADSSADIASIVQKTNPSGNVQASAPVLTADSTACDTSCCDVLVVEDNQVNQLVVRQLLLSLGHRCDVAANGLEAIEMLQRKQYRIVLMDGHMPVMDGLRATSAIREMQVSGRMPNNPTLSIIALTANASSVARDSFKQAGADDFLSKPVTLQRLKATLDLHLCNEQYGCSPINTTSADPAEKNVAPTASASWLNQDGTQNIPQGLPAGSHLLRTRSTTTEVCDSNAATENLRVNRDSPSPADFSLLFDSTGFDARCGSDDEFKRQVLELMRGSMGKTLKEIDEARSNRDFERLEGVSHRLNGASADCSLVAVSKAAASLETAADQGDSNQIELSYEHLQDSVHATLELLDRLLKEA